MIFFYATPIKRRDLRELRFPLSNNSLNEVNLQESLEVEVGKNLILANLQKGSKLGIGVNLSARYLVLKTVGGDVLVDSLTDLNAGHHGSGLLAKKLDELVTDDGGLHEAGGLSVCTGGLLALLGLGSSLELLGNGLLEELVISLHGRKDGGDLLNLGAKVVQLGSKGGSINRGGGLNNGGLNYGSLNYRGRGLNNGGSLGLLLGLGLLLNNGGRLDSDSDSRSSGNRGIRLSSFADHFLLYTLKG
jgi:hypothetical protein